MSVARVPKSKFPKSHDLAALIIAMTRLSGQKAAVKSIAAKVNATVNDLEWKANAARCLLTGEGDTQPSQQLREVVNTHRHYPLNVMSMLLGEMVAAEAYAKRDVVVSAESPDGTWGTTLRVSSNYFQLSGKHPKEVALDAVEALAGKMREEISAGNMA